MILEGSLGGHQDLRRLQEREDAGVRGTPLMLGLKRRPRLGRTLGDHLGRRLGRHLWYISNSSTNTSFTVCLDCHKLFKPTFV
jgi:hypothetical protein